MYISRLINEEEKESILKYKDTLSFAKANSYYGVKSLLDNDILSEEEREGYTLISNLLKEVIADFVSFSGFIDGDTLRIQYRWSPLFTGMGLVTLHELMYGFEEGV